MPGIRRATPNPVQQFHMINGERQYLHDVDGAAEYLVKQMCRIAAGEIGDPVTFAKRSIDGVRAFIMVQTPELG